MWRIVIHILTGAIFIQLVFFGAFLLIKRSPNKVSNRLLAAFFFSETMSLGNLVLSQWQSFFVQYAPHLFYVGFSFFFLWGPFLFLYVRSMTRSRFRLKARDALHAIPFFCHQTFSTLRFHRFSSEFKRQMILQGGPQTGEVYLFVIVMMQAQILIYLVLSLLEWRRYRSEIKNSMSSVERQTLSWIAVVLAGFFAHWICDTGYYTVHSLFQKNTLPVAVLAMLVFWISVQILMVQNLNQSAVLFGLSDKPKYAGSALTDDQKTTYIKKLDTIMAEQKPYLDPMLTLPALARITKIPPHHLSQILNEHKRQNFFDYINSHRIEESKRMLKEKNDKGQTIMSVLLEAGFNSKSAFNSAFKRYTGMTPSSFIRSM